MLINMENIIEKKLEKEIEKDVENEVKNEIENKLGKKLDKDLEKNLKKDIAIEVKKRVNSRIDEWYKYTKDTTIKSTAQFKKEFKNQTLIAITAALAFLIALSWRTPIEKSVNNLKISLGLVGESVFLEYLSAIFITLIAVIALIVVSYWNSDKKKD